MTDKQHTESKFHWYLVKCSYRHCPFYKGGGIGLSNPNLKVGDSVRCQFDGGMFVLGELHEGECTVLKTDYREEMKKEEAAHRLPDGYFESKEWKLYEAARCGIQKMGSIQSQVRVASSKFSDNEELQMVLVGIEKEAKDAWSALIELRDDASQRADALQRSAGNEK
jgi:hypothetical protein